MATDHSASSAMILRIRRTPAPELGPLDFTGGGMTEGFEGCGPVLEAWPAVEDWSWVEMEDWSWVEIEDQLRTDSEGVIWVSSMLGADNTGTSGLLDGLVTGSFSDRRVLDAGGNLEQEEGMELLLWRVSVGFYQEM